jgi:phytoene synthase
VLLACASVRSGWVGRDLVQVPSLAAIAYLVDHCHAVACDLAASEAAASAAVNGRVAWMLDLFERLEVHKLDQMQQRESMQRRRRQLSH